MLKITDFSRIAGVSARTLRYYDDLSLLKPIFIDPTSGYRYYDIRQLARLNRILALKDLGFSLDQIANLLDAEITTSQMRDYLRQQERDVEARLRVESERLRRIRDRLYQIEHENDPVNIDVIVKRAEAQVVVGNRMIIPTTADLMFFCNHMLAEIYRWLKQHNIAYTPTQLILYQGDEYSEVDLDTEVVVVLPELPAVRPAFPHAAMRLFELPAVPLLVTTIYHGRLQEATKTLRDLVRWCEQAGYGGITHLTMLREAHLFQPINELHPIPLEGTIEFQLPVERATP